MGQKVNPHGMRVGIINDWESRWYADDKEFSESLIEDYKIRQYVQKKLTAAQVSRVEIERAAGRLKVIIHSARPGLYRLLQKFHLNPKKEKHYQN